MVLLSWEKYEEMRACVRDGNLKGKGEESPVKKALSQQHIISAIAPRHRRQVETILHYIENDSNISWNEKGEIIIKGNIIPHTHITDLLKDTIREYKHFAPTGADIFYQALADSNLPIGLIGNLKRREKLEKNKQTRPPGIAASQWLKWN